MNKTRAFAPEGGEANGMLGVKFHFRLDSRDRRRFAGLDSQ